MNTNEDPLKFLVISTSGSVGKSTIAREVLASNMPNAKILQLEKHNSGNENYKIKNTINVVSGTKSQEDIVKLTKEIFINESLIVDVGVSIVNDFIELLNYDRELISMFDRIIIPTRPRPKIQNDTITTINILLDLGIEPAKILVVANETSKTEYEEKFKPIIVASKKLKFNISKNLTIMESETILRLENSKQTLVDFIDKTKDFDWEDAISSSKSVADKKENMLLRTYANAATFIKADMDTVFKEITKPIKGEGK
ncbi:MAG: hypothetical protein DRG78_00175 [Epsilonproteobacteria bacterium]|nr:MAG: hypothetical protein DRG78_00175 [Campylobacterota bacterium]